MPHVPLSESRVVVVETSKQDERFPGVVWLSLFPISGGSVFAIALVLRAEGPADVASAGTLLPLPRPPGQHVAPQQFGGVWCWTADCQVKKSARLYIHTYMQLAWHSKTNNSALVLNPFTTVCRTNWTNHKCKGTKHIFVFLNCESVLPVPYYCNSSVFFFFKYYRMCFQMDKILVFKLQK